jgi:Sulfatase
VPVVNDTLCTLRAMKVGGGRIGRDWRDSVPWRPAEPAPPPGSPNVLLVVLDDVGYAQLGCYGSDIATPVIDGLAADGIRLANFCTRTTTRSARPRRSRTATTSPRTWPTTRSSSSRTCGRSIPARYVDPTLLP